MDLQLILRAHHPFMKPLAVMLFSPETSAAPAEKTAIHGDEGAGIYARDSGKSCTCLFAFKAACIRLVVLTVRL